MNATLLAQSAYANPGQPVRTARDIEYDAFARVTHRLKQAAAQEGEDFPRLVRAIHDNRHLWSLLAADVALPDNGLPAELRSRIIYLAEFTRQQSSKILSQQAGIAILIEINSAIMRGLRNESGDA